jgi:hypothetical protein
MFIRFVFAIMILVTYVSPTLLSGADNNLPKFNKARVEAYLRYAEGYVPAVKIAIDDPSPSDLDGYYRVSVHLTKDAATAERVYYTPDGEHFISGVIWDLNANPFLEALKRMCCK